MKKILLTLSAIVAILFAASCQRIENPSAPGAESKVTFSVQGPELMTRALGDGTTADQLTIAVYDGNGNYLEDLTQEVKMESKHANIELTLVNGMDYKIVFWAQANGAPYTFNKVDAELTVDYTNAKANDENRDAFYHYMEYKADGPKTEVVTLTRPFAQLNIATSDWEDALKSGLDLTQTMITVSSVNTQMNMLTREVRQATPTNVKFNLADIPAETLTGYDAYKWLSVNYLLVNEKEVVDITFETDAAEGSPKRFTSVPVQRNYRTIIYGQILTSDINFNIDTDPDFTLPDITVDGRVYKQVADIAAANALLAVENSSVYAIAITRPITADGTITLPPATNTNDVHIILPATDKKVTIEGNATKYLYVEIPNGTVYNLTLSVPNTTAHVNGNLVNVAASTASNTLYITGGKIENLTVNQGNVVVEKGAELTNINNQANETITVTLADDVTEPNKDQNSKEVTIETIKQEVTTLDELKTALGKLTTVTLGADITATEIITINRDLVLDGNGHTLTSNVDANKTSHRAINVSGASDVTIKNLTINTNGQRAINIIQSTKKVTIENVIATSDNYTVNIASSAEGATLVINNSDLTGKNTINMGGSYNTVTINNTKLTTIDDNEKEGYGSVSIGAITKGCKVVMNGGEITVTGEHSSDSREVSYVTAHNSFSYKGTTATDGEMNVINGVAVIDYNNNTYYTFKTLQGAVDKANTGETIILVDDVTLTETININKSLTIKLNGQKLTANVKAGRAFDIVADNVNFTLDATDSQVEFGNGTYGIIQLVADTDNATVTVNGGTFEGTTDAGALIRYRSGNDNTVNLTNVNYTENCEIKGQNTSNPYVVSDNGAEGTGCILNITGGKYNVGCMAAVPHVEATIENVTVIARGLTFELKNGSITGSDITLAPGAYVSSINGAGIIASNQGKVTITNTKITSSHKGLVVATTGGEIEADNITLNATEEDYYIYDNLVNGVHGKITVDGTVVAAK